MGEFPTAWHRKRYIEDLEREVAGAERRVAELKELGGSVTAETVAAAKEAVENAKTELERAEKTPVPSEKGDKGGKDANEQTALVKMKLDELREYAASVGIDAETIASWSKPGTKKADVVAAIETHEQKD